MSFFTTNQSDSVHFSSPHVLPSVVVSECNIPAPRARTHTHTHTNYVVPLPYQKTFFLLRRTPRTPNLMNECLPLSLRARSHIQYNTNLFLSPRFKRSLYLTLPCAFSRASRLTDQCLEKWTGLDWTGLDWTGCTSIQSLFDRVSSSPSRAREPNRAVFDKERIGGRPRLRT